MQVDDAHDIDLVMTTYDLIEYNDNHSKTSRTLWQYCRDEPTLNNNAAIVEFTVVKSINDRLTLFRMDIFGAAHGWGEGQKGPHSLKSVRHILQ